MVQRKMCDGADEIINLNKTWQKKLFEQIEIV